MFEPQSNVEIAPNISRAASDLAECLNHLLPIESTSLTPLERFLVIDPEVEPLSTESTATLAGVGIQGGEQASASLRVENAVKLAAEVMMLRRQVALQGTECAGDSSALKGNERSWLDLDEQSEASCSGVSRETIKKAEPRNG